MRVLAISGSLRAASTNTALVRAAIGAAPDGVDVVVFDGVGRLPLFNPDDEETAGPAVAEYRARLRDADAVLISSPEYAHGVPGGLKNALDWVVGTGELYGKPVALIMAPRAAYALASLTETLTVMGAVIIAGASIVVSPTDPSLDAALRAALQALVAG